MGHLVGKDVYRKLGRKIDGLSARVPWNDTLYEILKELYTTEEAELVVKMPYRMCTVENIRQVSGFESNRLESLLAGLAEKGLVIDIQMRGKYYYIISPLVVGIFEFTMMRTRGELNTKQWARLFHDYLQDQGSFYRANFGKNQRISPLRALPHEGSIEDSEHVEILDYEKAGAIVDAADKFAIGICSCRHEKLHVGAKTCDHPLETCSSFGMAAEHLTSHGLAREVTKSEMMECLERSRESGLVFCADNVRKDVSFICHCCGCCCNVLLGISRFGYPNILVTSNYIASCDPNTCTQCSECVEACPIDAVDTSSNGHAHVDETLCVGCGVCALACDSEAMKLTDRPQRVFHPEDSFERVILQHLERGNLQNLLFANPQSVSHSVMRAVVGAFLKLPPVQKALMSDTLRSSFLERLRS